MRHIFIFFGIIFFIEGILLFMGFNVISGFSKTIIPTPKNILISFSASILCIIVLFFLKDKEKKVSICPKCKEAFNYNELEDGKCKYCKNVDTVDIKQYYKHNQHKQDEKI